MERSGRSRWRERPREGDPSLDGSESNLDSASLPRGAPGDAGHPLLPGRRESESPLCSMAWTSDQARLPAEFKHITKRRKRN